MRKIGSSTLEVSGLNLGGNTFGWTASEAESHAVLDAYADAGGNFIDTADVYSEWKPRNGQIICHCEKVTQSEIHDALNSEIPAKDLKGLGRRTRAGLGRCQGFYCHAALRRLIASAT